MAENEPEYLVEINKLIEEAKQANETDSSRAIAILEQAISVCIEHNCRNERGLAP